MEKKYLFITLTVFFAVGLFIGGVYAYRQSGEQPEADMSANLIGVEKDAHGCEVTVGYSWCEEKEKCLRTGEEDCVEVSEATESDIDAIRQAFMEKYQKEASEVQITIEKFNGNYARGGVKFSTLGQFGEGGIFLAYRDEAAWHLAFDGNGMISCSEMAEFDFPSDMTLGCFDENTGEVQSNSQLANPASANCMAKGGELDIRTGEDGGQYGMCVLPDGSECEEWAMLRGECELTE